MTNGTSTPNMAAALEEILARGVEAARVAQQPTMVDTVRGKSPEQWSDEEWEFANQRGLIPASHQSTYELRLLEARQAAERAQLLAWQGGNHPLTGTVGAGARGVVPQPDRPIPAVLDTGIRERHDTLADVEPLAPDDQRRGTIDDPAVQASLIDPETGQPQGGGTSTVQVEDDRPYDEWEDSELEQEMQARQLDLPAKNMARGKRHDAMVKALEKHDEDNPV